MKNLVSPHGGFVNEGTISHGTLRTQDLLRRFASEYERLLPFNSAARVTEARELADVLDADETGQVANMSAGDALNELIDCLDDIAQKHGLYFGATEGDGSDFGFWRIEDEDEAEDA